MLSTRPQDATRDSKKVSGALGLYVSASEPGGLAAALLWPKPIGVWKNRLWRHRCFFDITNV